MNNAFSSPQNLAQRRQDAKISFFAPWRLCARLFASRQVNTLRRLWNVSRWLRNGKSLAQRRQDAKNNSFAPWRLCARLFASRQMNQPVPRFAIVSGRSQVAGRFAHALGHLVGGPVRMARAPQGGKGGGLGRGRGRAGKSTLAARAGKWHRGHKVRLGRT